MNEPEITPGRVGIGPLRRLVDPDHVVLILSGLLGITPARHPAAPQKIAVDAGALLTWVREGVAACQMPAEDDFDAVLRGRPWMPAARALYGAARKVALTIVMERYVSITAAAEAMTTSRRALRDSLKLYDLYEQFRDRYRPRRKAKPQQPTTVEVES